MEFVIVLGAAFLAGFIDSIAGGGGLIQLPALLIAFPNVPIATCFGTNKFASLFGTSAAALQYAREMPINFRATAPAAIAALLFSFLGARTVSLLDPSLLKPVVLGLLVLVLIYTAIKKDLGSVARVTPSSKRTTLLATIIGAVLGFYDGFFGPGTGSFLLLCYVTLLGFDFLTASGSAKIINIATNIAALAFFIPSGNVVYKYAIPMAICNVLGSQIGARLAIVRGSKFVRVVFITVVSALIVKLGVDTL